MNCKVVIGLFLLFFFFAQNLFAQDYLYDPFRIAKKGLFKSKTVIRKSGFTLTSAQIVEYMANDPEMIEYTKPLMGLYLAQTLLNLSGTVLSTWPLIQLEFTDKEPNVDLTYIGLGILAGSLVLQKLFTNKAVKAANYYNNGYQETAGIQIRPISNQHGVGLAFVFY